MAGLFQRKTRTHQPQDHHNRNSDALLSPLIRYWQIRYDVRIILWVDDICVVVSNTCANQDICGKCTECPRCKIRAWELDTKDIKALGLETNHKDVPR